MLGMRMTTVSAQSSYSSHYLNNLAFMEERYVDWLADGPCLVIKTWMHVIVDKEAISCDT